MARRRFDDEGSGALSENFLSVPESEGLPSSIPQPAKPPVPRIRRSMFPNAVSAADVAAAGGGLSQVAAPPAPPSRASRLPPPALPPKVPPLPPMRAPMHSDSGVTLRRERDPEPTTAAISIENPQPKAEAFGDDLDEGNSVTKMHPADAEQLAKSRRPELPTYAVEEPTALFDRSVADSKAGTASARVDSSKEEESTRLFDRSQLIDSRAMPASSDFEASTRVVRDERPRTEAKSVPPPLHSPLVPLHHHADSPVISSLQEYGGNSGSLSQEAISLQSGDLIPIDEPSSPWARVDSSAGRSMRFDFGDDAPESDARSELEFLPQSLEMDPARPFADSLGSPRMPLDLSLDSSDVISAPPSLEPLPPPSVRPPPVASPIDWGRRERKAPMLGRVGAGAALPAPGRLAGRPRNLAGPPRPQKHPTPPPPPPEPAYSEPEAIEPQQAYREPSFVAPVEPAYTEPPAHVDAAYAPPPVHAAPSPQSESYVPQPRQPIEGYQTGPQQAAYVPYGEPAADHDNAFGAAPSGAPSLPDYEDPPPLSDLPDPRGYSAPLEAQSSAEPDPYAPAPEWGAGFLNGKRPDSSYREFPRPGQGASSEASFVGGKFIDESVQSSRPGAVAKNAAYDSMTGPRRDLVSPAAERSYADHAKGSPYFPEPPPSSRSSEEAPLSSEGPPSSYDSGISQQFQSLPILPTASELLAQAAGRGQPAQLGAPPPTPRPVVATAPTPAPQSRSRVLWLAYSLLLGGVGMVALVHFTFGDEAPAKTTAPVATASAPPVATAAPPAAPAGGPYGYGPQPGVIGMQQPGAYGYPQQQPGMPPAGYAPYGTYPGAPPTVYATPTDVTPAPTEEPSAKPKPKAPPKATTPKAPPPAPPKPKDDERPPTTSDSKPAKDSSGKASSDLFDNAL